MALSRAIIARSEPSGIRTAALLLIPLLAIIAAVIGFMIGAGMTVLIWKGCLGPQFF
jgi:hypothetical protein